MSSSGSWPSSSSRSAGGETALRRWRISPERYAQVALLSAVGLAVVVLTGAGVRLTDSGLGCPDWPRCEGEVVPPLSVNALIEFGNRVFSGLVGVVAVAAFVCAWLREPRDRGIVALAALPPLGAAAQGGVGAFVVSHHLTPALVMLHFGLSMLILVPAVALVWRARTPPQRRGRPGDPLMVWTVRAAMLLGGLTLFAGTVATAAGPHAGADDEHQVVDRLSFRGGDTLEWAIHRHALIAVALGLTVILAWWLARKRGGSTQLVEALTLSGILMAAQGLLGSVQYGLGLPPDMVWAHVALATANWIVLLWATANAGRPSRASRADGGRARRPARVRAAARH